MGPGTYVHTCNSLSFRGTQQLRWRLRGGRLPDFDDSVSVNNKVVSEVLACVASVRDGDTTNIFELVLNFGCSPFDWCGGAIFCGGDARETVRRGQISTPYGTR